LSRLLPLYSEFSTPGTRSRPKIFALPNIRFKLYYSFNEKGFDLNSHDSPRNVVSTTSLLDAAAEYVAFLGSFYAWSLPNPFQPLVTEFFEPLRSIATSAPLQLFPRFYISGSDFSINPSPFPEAPRSMSTPGWQITAFLTPRIFKLQAVVNTSFMRTLGYQASAVSHNAQGVQNPKNSRPTVSASFQLGPSSQSGLTQAASPHKGSKQAPDYGPCLGYCLYTLFGKPCVNLAKPQGKCTYYVNGACVPLSHDQELKALPPNDQRAIAAHFKRALKPTLSAEQIRCYGP
jgi:hypothetical protein